MKDKLIAIVGPTATGKSEIAVEIAARLHGEIISADSAQVYRGFNIGTAKIKAEERKGIPHHLLDIVGPETEYNIGRYQIDAKASIDAVLNRRNIPILCGGSGLYIHAVLNESYDLSDSPANDPDKREELKKIEEERGEGALYEMLKNKFPRRAEKIHPHDLQRIVRALEMKYDLEEFSGDPWACPYNALICGLNTDRAVLYQRIEKRVDQMFKEGLVHEVADLLAMGYPKNGNALSALGYKEILPIFEGEYDEETAKEILKKNTRHFAKRQITWFKRDPRIHWFEINTETDKKNIVNEIIMLEKKLFK